MTALLTAVAVVATFVLVLSALGEMAKGTPRDASTRGPWGVVTWTSTRDRSLDPQARRWQTAIVSAETNPMRWRDLVAEIETLERIGDVVPVGQAPKSFSRAWLEASIANLERATTT